MSSDQLPPHDIAAECSTLGSMLISAPDDLHIVTEIATIIGPGDFYLPKHADLFRACMEVFNATGSIDSVQLESHLRQHNITLGTDDLEGELVDLVETVPIATNGPYYARIVRDKSTRRKLITACDALERATREGKPVDQIIGRMETALAESSQTIASRRTRTIGEAALEFVEQLNRREEGDSGGIDTGFATLDNRLCGLAPGDMCVLAARPGHGKTQLALQIAEEMARERRAVGMFSLEMPDHQLSARIISARAGVDSIKLRRNAMTDEERERIVEAAQSLTGLPFHVDDTPAVSPPMLKAKVRELVDRHGCELIIVDYLQIMQAVDRSVSRNEQVTEFSASIKQAARQNKVPIIALCQLNRHPSEGANFPPNMSRLRDSGAIEQDADQILMIHRPEKYDANCRPGEVDLIIEKNRHGSTGTVVLTWNDRTATFGEALPPGLGDEVEAEPEPHPQTAMQWD